MVVADVLPEAFDKDRTFDAPDRGRALATIPPSVANIEPEASNTSMASSVQGGRCISSMRAAWTPQATNMSCVPERLPIGAY